MIAWALLAIVAAVAEIALPQFGVIFVSVGAAAAALTTWLGGGTFLQIVVFIAVVGASLGFLRPRVMRWLSSGPGVPSRTDRLTSQEGVVTQAIDVTLGTGRVTVSGEDWAARSATPISEGTHVRVVGSDGIVLEVAPL